jgi:hypothetical protein
MTHALYDLLRGFRVLVSTGTVFPQAHAGHGHSHDRE